MASQLPDQRTPISGRSAPSPVVDFERRMAFAPFVQGDTGGRRNEVLHDADRQVRLLAGARRDLYRLQAATAELPEVDCPLQHSFIDGVYVRTIFIPAGTVIVGKIHKHSHANILSQGEVSVFTEGGGLQRFKGPLTMVSAPGTKRAVYAHTDTTWTTIHSTSETDLDKIEKYVIAETYQEYEQFLLEHKEPTQAEEASL